MQILNLIPKQIKSAIAVLNFLAIVTGCKHDTTQILINESQDKISIQNAFVKAEFTKKEGTIFQQYYAKKNGEWQAVISNFNPPADFPKEGVQLFNPTVTGHRFLSNAIVSNFEVVKSEDKVDIILKGDKDSVPVEQKITLNENANYFHFDVKIELLGKPARLDYALSTYAFNINHAPSFVHTPGLKFDNTDSRQNRFNILPGKDQVTGDRAYHSPAVIVQDGGLFAAIVPDLNSINKNQIVSPDARRTMDIKTGRFSVAIEDDKYTMPTGLDLNVKTGISSQPVMTYGYMDNIIAHHIRYQRVNDSSMIRTLNTNKVEYGFDLFVGADVPEYEGFQRISKHLWTQYGKEVFDEHPHLAMPFDEYFKIIDSITFHPITYDNINIDLPLKGYKNTGSWLEWEEDRQKMGGYRSAIEWWNDVLHNSAFWNNAREAQGFWYWGNKLNRPDLIEKGRSIINWSLSAPRNDQGLFALLYKANEKEWALGFTDPVNNENKFFLKESDSYDVSTMSKTGAHLLDYYLRCEADSRITEYLKPYGDWLLSVIDNRGAVPSYVDAKNMQASNVLYYSAQPSSSMWFLSELYRATKEEKYLEGAKAIAIYLKEEIIPQQNWIDMEQFFSCGFRPLDFTKDLWQNQVARGNLSLFWATEGFASLYEATREQEYLSLGEKCVDYASFFQCGWDPHYIYTAFPFGGFSSDNADNANFLDARQAEMVKPYIWYGKALGRQDLMERGVAAARSSVVLMNHPRHKSNNIYRHTNIYPYGLGPENIDHEAHPQSAMRTHPSWGEGSGVFTGLAEAGRALGGAYIDFHKKISVGVDGLHIDTASLEGKSINLKILNKLESLKEPWEYEFKTSLIMQGLNNEHYQLRINNSQPKSILGDSLLQINLLVRNNSIEIVP